MNIIKTAPKWPETSAKRMMPLFVQSPKLKRYLPDWKPGQREPNRDWLWTLMYAVDVKFAKNLLNECIEARARLAALTAKPARP